MSKEQIVDYIKMIVLILFGVLMGVLLQRGLDDGNSNSTEAVAIYITIPSSTDASAEVSTKVGPDETAEKTSSVPPEVTVDLESVEGTDEPIEVKTVSFTPQPINRDFDILTPSGYTADQLVAILSDDSHKEMVPYVDAILEAEKTYGVNALYLLCKLGLESGWGKYESGENNIGGWTNNKGGFKDFASVDECVMHIAKALSGSYKDAVGTRLEDVCKRYCPDEGYTELLLEIMTDMEKELSTTGV